MFTVTDFTVRIDQLTGALYSTAAVLIESIADPEALAQATLKERAYATKVVSHMLATLRSVQPEHPSIVPSQIQWTFAESGQSIANEALIPDMTSALSQPVVVETSPSEPSVPPAPPAAQARPRTLSAPAAVDVMLGRASSGLPPAAAPLSAVARKNRKSRASRRAHERVLARAGKSC